MKPLRAGNAMCCALPPLQKYGVNAARGNNRSTVSQLGDAENTAEIATLGGFARQRSALHHEGRAGEVRNKTETCLGPQEYEKV